MPKPFPFPGLWKHLPQLARRGLRLLENEKIILYVNGVFRLGAAALEHAIRDYLTIHNRNPKPFGWSKSADDILASLARFCSRISDSRH